MSVHWLLRWGDLSSNHSIWPFVSAMTYSNATICLHQFNAGEYLSIGSDLKVSVMANFMCQRGCITEHIDVVRHYTNVSVGVLLDEIKHLNLSKADCPPLCEWASSNQLQALVE